MSRAATGTPRGLGAGLTAGDCRPSRAACSVCFSLRSLPALASGPRVTAGGSGVCGALSDTSVHGGPRAQACLRPCAARTS